MVELKNKNITLKIDEFGAEIKSLRFNEKECMWCGLPDIWNGISPLLFPICGGLKDDKFIYDGKEYTLPKHGFARTSKFNVEACDSLSATFLIKSNSETLESYPFEFELRVIYTLKNDGITVTYKVDNKSGKEMYFSIGSHEGFSTPEGIEDYDIIFPEKETLNAIMLDGALRQENTIPIIKNSNVLPLYDKCFTEDALVFKGLNSRSCTLRNRKTGRFVKVDFPSCDYFLLWHKHTAPYICIEPWSGINDPQETDYDITKKEGIITLEADKTYTATHTITFGED